MALNRMRELLDSDSERTRSAGWDALRALAEGGGLSVEHCKAAAAAARDTSEARQLARLVAAPGSPLRNSGHAASCVHTALCRTHSHTEAVHSLGAAVKRRALTAAAAAKLATIALRENVGGAGGAEEQPPRAKAPTWEYFRALRDAGFADTIHFDLMLRHCDGNAAHREVLLRDMREDQLPFSPSTFNILLRGCASAEEVREQLRAMASARVARTAVTFSELHRAWLRLGEPEAAVEALREGRLARVWEAREVSSTATNAMKAMLASSSGSDKSGVARAWEATSVAAATPRSLSEHTVLFAASPLKDNGFSSTPPPLRR